MAEIYDGGPAFPCTNEQAFSGAAARGMSLRDAAALAALPAIIAATSAGQHHPTKQPGDDHIRQAIARDAFAMADAFIAARAKETTR